MTKILSAVAIVVVSLVLAAAAMRGVHSPTGGGEAETLPPSKRVVTRSPTPSSRCLQKTGRRPALPGLATWPLPQLPAPEVEAKRAELLAAIRETATLENRTLQNEALGRICCEWAGFDPRGAVENAIAWELEEVPGLLEALALQWASADMDSAREWAEMQPASEFRSELVARVGFAMAQDDPASAADYVLRECSDQLVSDEALISVLHQWALKDLEAARRWTKAFTKGEIRDHALQDFSGVERYRTIHEIPESPFASGG